MRYTLCGGRIEVTARSSIHDTRCVWPRLEGTLEVDPAQVESGAAAELRVDMRVFDAGDRLKNWKLRSDLDPDRHPTATFRLAGLGDAREEGGRLHASATGTLVWRGHETSVTAVGFGRVTPAEVEAEATFDLDVRTLGVKPPKVLMFKVDSIVSIKVELRAKATPA